MTLENIPEMQLMISNDEFIPISFNFNSEYSAKFVQIIHEPSLKYYIFAVNKPIHLMVFRDFIDQIESEQRSDFRGVGGGKIDIKDKRVLFYDLSREYTKYNIEIVKPIAERYFSQHLPNAELVFK